MVPGWSAGAALWQRMRRVEFARLDPTRVLVVLPVGSIEQHGPHLPVDTDCWTAYVLSVRAAAELADLQVVVLPTIWWGVSSYWMSFPGTITLQPETLIALVKDIAGSVRHQGFHALACVNGHAGNEGALRAAASAVSSPSFRMSVLSWWALIPDVMRDLLDEDPFDDPGHSGEFETSMQLALRPNLVDLTEWEQSQGTLTSFSVASGRKRRSFVPPCPEHESVTGVYGRPTAGSAEKGNRFARAAISRLTTEFRVLADDLLVAPQSAGDHGDDEVEG
jgi:creatinine amidohydrolase